MITRAPLCGKTELVELAKPLKGGFKEAPDHLIEEARSCVASVGYADALLQSPIPFFFELSGTRRGFPMPGGKVRHGFDGEGRLVLVEPRDAEGETQAFFCRSQDTVDRFVIETDRNKGKRYTAEVGRTGHTSTGVSYDVLLSRGGDVDTYCWRSDAGGVFDIQAWYLSNSAPVELQMERSADGYIVRLLRKGREIWRAPDPNEPDPEPSVSGDLVRRISERVRERVAHEPEPILLITLCIEGNNAQYQPPQVGVVLKSTAQYFAAHSSEFEDGPNGLLSPTLQESLEFPVYREFPFVGLSEEDGIVTAWREKSLLLEARALVEALNTQRAEGEPPYLLVDMEGDATDYIGLLDDNTQRELRQYGIC